MTIDKKRDFLINCAYWALVALAVWVGFEYLLPVSMPFVFGIAIGFLVLRISNLCRCKNNIFRIVLAVAVYGILGLLVTLLCIKGVDTVSGIIRWLPEFYEHKILPLVTLTYDWFARNIRDMDPTLIGALEMVTDSLLSAAKNLISSASSMLVNLVSGLATGIPNLVFSLLAMIFSSISASPKSRALPAIMHCSMQQ